MLNPDSASVKEFPKKLRNSARRARRRLDRIIRLCVTEPRNAVAQACGYMFLEEFIEKADPFLRDLPKAVRFGENSRQKKGEDGER